MVGNILEEVGFEPGLKGWVHGENGELTEWEEVVTVLAAGTAGKSDTEGLE